MCVHVQMVLLIILKHDAIIFNGKKSRKKALDTPHVDLRQFLLYSFYSIISKMNAMNRSDKKKYLISIYSTFTPFQKAIYPLILLAASLGVG